MSYRRSFLAFIVFLVAFAGSIVTYAIPQVVIKGFNRSAGGQYRTSPNEELDWILDGYALGKSTDGTWFGTFSLEKNESLGGNKTHDVAFNRSSVSGGRGGAINGKDPISIGTAYLYEQFVLGSLTGFN